MKKTFLRCFLLSFCILQVLSHEPPTEDIEKQNYIDSFLEIKGISSKYINTYLDDFAVPAFRYSIKNNGTETITELWVRVFFLDKNGNPFFDEDYLSISEYSDMKLLKPNYTFRMETGTYMTVKEIDPKEWSGEIKIEILTNKLKFEQ